MVLLKVRKCVHPSRYELLRYFDEFDVVFVVLTNLCNSYIFVNVDVASSKLTYNSDYCKKIFVSESNFIISGPFGVIVNGSIGTTANVRCPIKRERKLD